MYVLYCVLDMYLPTEAKDAPQEESDLLKIILPCVVVAVVAIAGILLYCRYAAGCLSYSLPSTGLGVVARKPIKANPPLKVHFPR